MNLKLHKENEQVNFSVIFTFFEATIWKLTFFGL